jgi:hypothetical protein
MDSVRSAFDPKRTKAGSKSRSAAGSFVLIVGGSTGGGWQRPLDSETIQDRRSEGIDPQAILQKARL